MESCCQEVELFFISEMDDMRGMAYWFLKLTDDLYYPVPLIGKDVVLEHAKLQNEGLE